MYISPEHDFENPVISSKFNLRRGLSDITVKTEYRLNHFHFLNTDKYGNLVQERVFYSDGDVLRLIMEIERIVF